MRPRFFIVDPDNRTTERAITDTVAIAEGLFTLDAEPCLIGGRNRDTGRIVFPCPGGDMRYDRITLPRRGRIWSWTVQRFRPKSPPYIGPEAFEPFALAYIELPGALIVEGRLTGIAFDAIRIGMAVETVVIPFAADAGGRAVLTYAFAPAGEENARG